MHHGGLPGVKLGQLLADFECDGGCAERLDDAVGAQDLGQAAAFHILHGHEEVAIRVAELVDFDHARVERMQFLLDGGAAAFSFEHQLIDAVAIGLHQFERSLAVLDGVACEIDLGHALADAADDFVAADAGGGGHGRIPRGKARPAAGRRGGDCGRATGRWRLRAGAVIISSPGGPQDGPQKHADHQSVSQKSQPAGEPAGR